ncbi:uncharacterized protein LOC129589374 [Paramacrobiotus metropolitanus]|uniref:uncharacterized protein LOC129589374 n=1 Tax=Paramacrobiotus metropolitanus TaxID=2943436 RepID=UPI002445B716|nr:uncharacterized protein LOC129589374 [Paramacrobiotus metropolitanus]
MSRRVIQPPGGASSIFFGGEEPAKKAPPPAKTEEQKPAETEQIQSQQQQQQVAAAGSQAHVNVKKQTDESPENTFAQAQGMVPERSNQVSQPTEASRNKDKQKSSIVFGDDPVSEPKARGGRAPAPAASTAPSAPEPMSQGKDPRFAESDGAKDVTSIKIHHPPGGKSSGPLW